MPSLPRDIIVGAIGSVLGAFIVYIGSHGLRLTRAARESSAAEWQQEREQWQTRNMGIRQGITNSYLFQILRFMLLGNIFWAAPSVSMFTDVAGYGLVAFRVVMAVGTALSLLYFFLALGKASRYMRLRALDRK